MGGIDTRGRYHVHWGAPETYGERREESALRRSGRTVPDPAYRPFAAVDLAALDGILEDVRPRPGRDAADPRGDPGRVRLPAGRGAQADQPADRCVVRDDLRHRHATTATSASSRPRRPSQAAAVDAHRPPEATYLARARGARDQGARPPASRRGRSGMVDLLRTPAAWPTILLERAGRAGPDRPRRGGPGGRLRRPPSGHPQPRRRPRRSRRSPASGLRGRGGAGFPAARQVADRGRDRRAAPLRRGQRLRRRPGDRHGPVPARARPVRGHRGRRHRRLRDRCERGDHRGPRRRDRGDPRGSRRPSAPPRRPASSASTSSAPATTSWSGPAGPGRLHAGRGDRPAQGPRGQARPARAAPAAPGRARPVRHADRRPQRPDPRGRAVDRPPRRRRVRARPAPPDSPGTILVQVRTPAGDGIAEVPLGTPLRDVVGLGGKLPAGRVHQGRSSSAARPAACCRPTCSTRRMTSSRCARPAPTSGPGSVVVADDRACIVDLARLLTRFCAGEACGKTIPCRIGTRRLVEIADRVDRRPAATDRPELARRTCRPTSWPPPCATTSG